MELIMIALEQKIAERMQQRQLSDEEIRFFLNAWRQLQQNPEPIDWQDLSPLPETAISHMPEPGSPSFEEAETLGRAHQGQAVIIKLNGGRSTTMGGTQPKCSIEAKSGKIFLDIVLGQVISDNDQSGVEVPLVLMNSFFTDQASTAIVAQTPLLCMNFMREREL
jgi:UTP--glucose-1-phosphate uridylyltransferase